MKVSNAVARSPAAAVCRHGSEEVPEVGRRGRREERRRCRGLDEDEASHETGRGRRRRVVSGADRPCVAERLQRRVLRHGGEPRHEDAGVDQQDGFSIAVIAELDRLLADVQPMQTGAPPRATVAG